MAIEGTDMYYGTTICLLSHWGAYKNNNEFLIMHVMYSTINSIKMQWFMYFSSSQKRRCNMAFIEPVHHDKPSVSHFFKIDKEWKILFKEKAGRCFNIKMPSYQYRNSHCEDEIVWQLISSVW